MTEVRPPVRGRYSRGGYHWHTSDYMLRERSTVECLDGPPVGIYRYAVARFVLSNRESVAYMYCDKRTTSRHTIYTARIKPKTHESHEAAVVNTTELTASVSAKTHERRRDSAKPSASTNGTARY